MPEHDASYKLLLAHREMVAHLIRGFVREDWVASLDLSTLERVREVGISDDLRERDDDILWRLRLNRGGKSCWLYLYLLLEFRSTVDAFMAGRLMTYSARSQRIEPALHTLMTVFPTILECPGHRRGPGR